MRYAWIQLVYLCCFAPLSFADAVPPSAAIASAHPLATQAGFEVLDAGGNAFDAAVAVTATLAVVEPYSSGLGGGGFWLLHDAARQLDVMIDGRETAPAKGHRDMYLDAAGKVVAGLSVDGPLAAGIPGVPASMVYMAKMYGKLPLERTLVPAIRYASDGFKVDAYYQRLAKFRKEVLQRWPDSAQLFLVNNAVPEEGYVLKQPDLAKTLTALAQRGAAGFYLGEVAKKLVDGVQQAGGIWTLDDLASYQLVIRKPVVGFYRDIKVISVAPPSSGGIALVTMLNILNQYALDKMAPIQRRHLIVEAMRRAYRDRAVYLGDDDFVKIPQARLISADYAAGLAASVRLDKATPSQSLPGIGAPSEGHHTTHFSVLDQDGNRVAATVTINYPFGSGFVAPGTGVLLNDEMDDFSIKPGVPNVYGLVGAEANAVAPGKRPLSSMSPTFLESDRGIAILGTPGGSRIITMVLLAILDYAEGNDPASWVNVGRFHHQYLPDVIEYEKDVFSPADILAMEALGHTVKQARSRYGNMQAILWRPAMNQVLAAADPRGIGQAEVRAITLTGKAN